MFTPTTLFKAIACPEGEKCQLLNCIYNHEHPPQQIHRTTATSSHPISKAAGRQHSDGQSPEPPSKRRKVTYESLADKPPSRAEQIRAQLAKDRTKPPSSITNEQKPLQSSDASPAPGKPIATLERTVSPPRISAKTIIPARQEDSSILQTVPEQSAWSRLKQVSRAKSETLNPRMLNPAPDSHARRVLYVQHIHSSMVRLNKELRANTEKIDGTNARSAQAFVLDDAELITLALDEEENTARTKPKVYVNTIRNCVAAYQKMTIQSWIAKLKLMAQLDDATPVKAITTPSMPAGLPTGQEHLILPHLVVADQSSLRPYGYVNEPPSEEEANEAREAVDFSRNHEECDRCGRRFKVFPDREPGTGRLTSNGVCRYHWARKSIPTKQKTDHYTGSNEAMYPCCGQAMGTEGCTEHEEHVFKSSAPKRLAAVMPFMSTPYNPLPRSKNGGSALHAVVFDCEMGYTTNGMELIRLTAVSWPDGADLVDVLVRPLGAIIDLNTRFSGVKPEDMTNASPLVAGGATTSEAGRLTVVDSPATARQLLCDFLTPDTPLIGHAIDNDLNATRLCHPTIIDTVLLFSHPRGLPYRFGLKMLAKKYLKRDIQTGGSAGHDSREDAVATGDLVKVKVADMWRELKERGWKVENGQLVKPPTDNSSIGWRNFPSKSSKAKPVSQNNGLAKILEEARSIQQPQLTPELLET